MPDCAACEGEVRISEEGYYANTVDPIDVWNDLVVAVSNRVVYTWNSTYPLHCEIPVLIEERLVADCK